MNALRWLGIAFCSVTVAIPGWGAEDQAKNLSAEQLGNALVEVQSVRIAKPSVKSGGRAKKASKEGLILQIKVTNKNESRNIDYQTWNVDSNSKVAKATDDNGKKLAVFGQWPYVGSSLKTTFIEPGRWFRDTLVFEAPSPTAKQVTVELPGESVGSKGVLKLVVALKENGAQTPPESDGKVAMLPAQHIIDAKLTGEVDTGVNPRIESRGIPLGSFTRKGWEVGSKFKSKAAIYFSTGYTGLPGKQTVHRPGIVALKFADGTTAQVALPKLAIDNKGDATDGAGRPVPKTRGKIRVFLGSDGNSYYDEAGTKLAASLKKAGAGTQPPTQPTAKLPLRTWTSASGQYTVKARFVRFKDGAVTLERASGKTIDVPIERLSAADRTYVRAKTAPK